MINCLGILYGIIAEKNTTGEILEVAYQGFSGHWTIPHVIIFSRKLRNRSLKHGNANESAGHEAKTRVCTILSTFIQPELLGTLPALL